jgi:hypothetical protein
MSSGAVMPDGSDRRTNPDDENPFAVDFSVAHPARVQSYLAGGGSHFAADREAAEKMAASLPGGVETARGVVRVLGAFVRRTMRYLAGEADVRQFVSVGVAPPSERKVHDVVWEVAPDARFVYISDDAVVLAESHELRRGAPDGAIAYVHGTLPDLPKLLGRVTDTLDLATPIAVSLVTTLSFEPDESNPHAIVAEVVGMLAPASHLVVAHPSFDISAAGMSEASERLSQRLNVPWVVRSRDEIARFFDGLDMVDPGLVPIEDWRPDDDRPRLPGRRPTPIFAGVGRKL